jgi:hypothetical protein
MPSKFIKVSNNKNGENSSNLRIVEANIVSEWILKAIEKYGPKSAEKILAELDQGVKDSKISKSTFEFFEKILKNDAAEGARVRAKILKNLRGGPDATLKVDSAFDDLSKGLQKPLGPKSPIANGSRYIGNMFSGWNEKEFSQFLQRAKITGTDAQGKNISTTLEAYLENPSVLEINWSNSRNAYQIQELVKWKNKYISANKAGLFLSSFTKLGIGAIAFLGGKSLLDTFKQWQEQGILPTNGPIDLNSPNMPFPGIMGGGQDTGADEFMPDASKPGPPDNNYMYLNPKSKNNNKFIRISEAPQDSQQPTSQDDDESQFYSAEDDKKLKSIQTTLDDAQKMISAKDVMNVFNYMLKNPNENSEIMKQLEPYSALADKYNPFYHGEVHAKGDN